MWLTGASNSCSPNAQAVIHPKAVLLRFSLLKITYSENRELQLKTIT
jgi:hypothetical protein